MFEWLLPLSYPELNFLDWFQLEFTIYAEKFQENK